jgi:hypothetical protein
MLSNKLLVTLTFYNWLLPIMRIVLSRTTACDTSKYDMSIMSKLLDILIKSLLITDMLVNMEFSLIISFFV